MLLDDIQKTAVASALNGHFRIINGGAGTGKTTIIKEIVRVAEQVMNLKVILCCATGKAAARLKEATGKETETIHRALGCRGNDIFTTASFEGKVIIMDESSMTDCLLMAEVMKRKPAKIILVGDQAQLPPVGPGQPFHDLIRIMPENVTTLQKCYRQTEAVFAAATAIRNGQLPLEHDESPGEKWDIYDTGDSAATEEVVLSWATQFLDFSTDIILCPKNGRQTIADDDFQPCTVRSLNQKIKDLVNPTPEPIGEGDRVINTKNMPDLDIWNGTTGTVLKRDDDGRMILRLDTPITDKIRSTPEKPAYTDEIALDKSQTKHLDLAYALTVHKSQGSQYRRVVFVTLQRDTFILDRALIYTAVTRAKEQCIIVGNPSAFRQGIAKVREKETLLPILAQPQT